MYKIITKEENNNHMNNLTVLLVEDDLNTCKKFAEYVEKRDDISIIYTTNSATQAIENISLLQPDAVILDLELHLGSGSGLQVLSGLIGLEIKPYFLVTTNNSSSTTYEYARQLGADYIMYKHQDSYSEKEVIDFLCSMKKIIKHNKIHDNCITHESVEQKNKRIDSTIEKMLDCIGVKTKYVGYKYLRDAIHLLYDGNSQNICDTLGKRYEKSEASVERAMQYAIDVTWNTTDYDILLEHYTARLQKDKSCPTITEFIYYYANKLKQYQR